MSADNHPGELHLPDLAIQGFLGIRDLTINRLGRVTLIAGMNGVGKSTVLDAVRVFADRGGTGTLIDLLDRRDEQVEYQDEDGDSVAGIRWASLFHGRRFTQESTISIGPIDEDRRLTMCVRHPTENEMDRLQRRSEVVWDADLQTLAARHQGGEQATIMAPTPRRRTYMPLPREAHRPTRPSVIPCVSVGPGLLSGRSILDLWADIALTDSETRTIEALNLLGDGIPCVERVAVIGAQRAVQPMAIVRVTGQEQPIPLSSLGEGAVRMFGVALALANSRSGFLLIDEVENGIHHSVQERFWKMILKTACRDNVQVLATTHSWDTVAGYARAATQIEEVEGLLVRLECDDEGMFAVEYTQEDLKVAADQGIEVR